ncbi:MAG: BON domain-containing protein [Bryobacterales bacterium]
MQYQSFLATLAVFTLTGYSFAQTEQRKPERTEQPERQEESVGQSLEKAGRKAAGKIGDALESTEEAVKETLGLTKTGCLTRGDEADPFILVEDASGERITVVGSADLPKHVGHRITVHGSKESEGRVFHATKIEHVAASCDTAISRGPSAKANEPGDARSETASSAARTRGLTADDQGLSAADRKTTQSIRKALTVDEALSVYAKNVKIITRDGKVTLRGPVRTAEERESIAFRAIAIAGEGNVTNEITVDGAGSQR